MPASNPSSGSRRAGRRAASAGSAPRRPAHGRVDQVTRQNIVADIGLLTFEQIKGLRRANSVELNRFVARRIRQVQTRGDHDDIAERPSSRASRACSCSSERFSHFSACQKSMNLRIGPVHASTSSYCGARLFGLGHIGIGQPLDHRHAARRAFGPLNGTD